MIIILPYYIVIKLQKCLSKTGKLNPNYKKILDDTILYYIENIMKIPFKTVFHLWKENIYKIPICLTCGKPLFDFYKRNVVYCSTKCIDKKISYQKAQKTWNKKYGVDCYTHTKEFKIKIAKCNILREELIRFEVKCVSRNTGYTCSRIFFMEDILLEDDFEEYFSVRVAALIIKCLNNSIIKSV